MRQPLSAFEPQHAVDEEVQLLFEPAAVALTCVDTDGRRAREAARPIFGGFMGEFGTNAMTDAYGITDDLAAMIERGGPEGVTAEMPDEWMEDLALVGTPDEVAANAHRWLDAGLDSICVFNPDDALEQRTLDLVAEHVIPALR